MKNEYNNNNSKAKEKTSLSPSTKRSMEYGTKGDEEGELDSLKQIPYPKSVFFIITNEFCERFSYYGMKAVLILYLKNVLSYDEDDSTIIYHIFSMFCYFTPVFGAMLADSLLGKFRTILYLSIVYAIGNVVLSLSSVPTLNLPASTFTMVGLALIAIGTGGIKPCVSAFGGDQFTLPQQARQLTTFFSIFYFAINAGSLLSTCITPIFRKDVPCFGSDTCYPLAFGVPAILMVVSLIVFVIGKPWYTCRKPTGNILAQVVKCISHALSEKFKSNEKKEHWLDHASNTYDWELITSIKRLLKILVLYIPLPVFWALFDQQGSRWTFQATRMNGDVFGYLIKPDQMQVLNPLLILAFIPIFDQVLYPALGKVGLLKKPLQRLTVGGVLAGVAFVISGFLELQLESTYAVKLGAGQSHLNFVNNLNCTIQMEIGGNTTHISPVGQHIIETIKSAKYEAQFSPTGDSCKGYGSLANYPVDARSKEAKSYMISVSGNKLAVTAASRPDKLEKDGEGEPLLKFIFVGFENEKKLNGTIKLKKGDEFVKVWEQPEQDKDKDGHKIKAVDFPSVPISNFDSAFYKVEPVEHSIELMTPSVESKDVSEKYTAIEKIHPKQGGNYLYVITKEGNKFSIVEHTITKPNSIHMMWLVPQFVVITVGEVMFSVTGLEFAFSQAPASMKSVLQAAWLLTVAFGNVIVVFLAEFKPFEEQWKEFFLYSGLMFVDMIIFSILAYFYKPVQQDKKNEDDPNPNKMEMRENGVENDGYRDRDP